MPSLTYRSLYPEDIDQISKIESSLAGSPRRDYLEKRLAVATAMPDSFVTCAALDGERVAGYAFARIQEGEFGANSAVAVLDTLGVDSDFQGQGIGKQVLAGIERRMRCKGIGTLLTQISWSNHAMIRFFASTGFILATGQIIERDTSPLAKDAAADSRACCNSSDAACPGEGAKPPRSVISVRPLMGTDMAAIDRIDTKLTGMDRSAYFSTKFREMLDESGARVSMVAESNGAIAGFIMARVDFGEFGRVTKAAVLDSIGVHPSQAGSGIGHALLSTLLTDLAALQVEILRTKVEHENHDLRIFLSRRGFKPSQRLLLTKEIH